MVFFLKRDCLCSFQLCADFGTTSSIKVSSTVMSMQISIADVCDCGVLTQHKWHGFYVCIYYTIWELYVFRQPLYFSYWCARYCANNILTSLPYRLHVLVGREQVRLDPFISLALSLVLDILQNFCWIELNVINHLQRPDMKLQEVMDWVCSETADQVCSRPVLGE